MRGSHGDCIGMLYNCKHRLFRTVYIFDGDAFCFTVVNNWIRVLNRLSFGASPIAGREEQHADLHLLCKCLYVCMYVYTLLHMAVYVYCMCVSLCTYIHRQCFNGVMNIRTYMLNDHVRGLGRRVFNGVWSFRMETHSATCLWASYIREANPMWTSI